MACDAKQVPEDKIIKIANKVLNIETFDLKRFKEEVKQIVVLPDNKLLFQIVNGKNKVFKWKYESRSKSWTDEMKAMAKAHYLKRGKGGNS